MFSDSHVTSDGQNMISSIGHRSFDVFQQTAFGLGLGNQGAAIAKLSSLSSPSAAFAPVNITHSGGESMMNQLASEKTSADSGGALLNEVYQRVHKTLGLQGVDDESLRLRWKEDLSALKDTQKGLSDLEDQAVSSASGRLIHRALETGVDAAIKGYETALSLGGERGQYALKQAEKSVMVSLSRLGTLAEDLEKASLSVLKVQEAYGAGFGTMPQNFVFHEAQAMAGQRSGLVLDLVS
jgi:hypothetical protein